VEGDVETQEPAAADWTRFDFPAPRPTHYGRGESWVTFNGELTIDGDLARLVPVDDADVLVIMSAGDVRRVGHAVEVRVGARARSIDIPPTSFKNYPVNAEPSQECRGTGTRCVGGVRYCCDRLENRGACPRNWRCLQDE
jgi:hypothetical protein